MEERILESEKTGNEGERVEREWAEGSMRERKKEERMVESEETGNESDKEGWSMEGGGEREEGRVNGGEWKDRE